MFLDYAKLDAVDTALPTRYASHMPRTYRTLAGFSALCLFSLQTMLLVLNPTLATARSTSTHTPGDDGTLRRIRVPILMYHYVSDPPSVADGLRLNLTIRPGTFRAHIVYLNRTGYTPISLTELDDALRRGTPLPSKPIILTFDDGYVDHYTNVFPILQEFRFTGTFFVITGRADDADPRYLTWAQIQAMAAAGMSMESHSKTHADLRARSSEFLIYELLGSLQSLEAHTGREAHMFCYPSGHYDDDTLAIVRGLPIWTAVTTQHGDLHTTDGRLELARLRIGGDLGVAGLAQLLSGSPE